MRKLFALVFLYLCTPLALCQLLSNGALATSRTTDWTQAGIGGGIPSGSWGKCGSTIAPYGTSGNPASPSTIIGALTGGTPIASGAKTSTFTATCTGLATTDNISLDFNGDPTGITGFIPSSNGMLTILKFPASNTIEVYEINNTAASITPGTVVLNFHVYR